jgi:endo-1,4-beta-mannosidase
MTAGTATARPAFAGRFLLGANYWSRRGGPRMWERFDAAFVAAELKQLRAIGLDCLRMFAFVPSFMPSPPAVDPAMLDRLRGFGRLAEGVGLQLLPTAIVGHMSGENYDFPGRGGRSLYTDPEVLSWQTTLTSRLVEALRESPSVLGWVLSNEMPLYGGGATVGEATTWAKALTGAIRALDDRPVGAGDGLMASFPGAELAGVVDWIAPHVYYADLDPLRQAYNTDFTIRRAQAHGWPVLLEEFGCSSCQAGPLEQAAYFRESICAAFALGAAGAVGWCASDFDPEVEGREAPYSHHAFELGFGLFDKDGQEKPVCGELRALRALLDDPRVRLGAARRQPARSALVVPRYLDEEFPFSWEDKSALRRTLLAAYVLACQAGLDPDVVPETAKLDDYALLLCPATQKLLTPTWLALEAAARAGATVYWSYFSGDHTFHQGAWCPSFEGFTGLAHRLRYGCFDLPKESVTLGAPLKLMIPTGLRTVAAPQTLARLPVEPRSGAPVQVLVLDQEGRPALTEHRLDAGRVLFCPYPLERYLANLPDGSSLGVHRLYRLLGGLAGVEPRYPTRHPDVQSRVIEVGGDDLVVVQHRGAQAEVDDATFVPSHAERLYDRPGERRNRAEAGSLGQKGARVYRVPGVRAG